MSIQDLEPATRIIQIGYALRGISRLCFELGHEANINATDGEALGFLLEILADLQIEAGRLCEQREGRGKSFP